MIRLNMTREELLKELNADKEWTARRAEGIGKKFKRYLTDKKGREGVFYHCWYTTPNNNKVLVVYSKKILAGYVAIEGKMLFRVLGDDGKERYILGQYTSSERRITHSFLFTNHFVQRLRERTGKDMEKWFIERCKNGECVQGVFDYDYNGVENQCYAIMNGNMAFGVRSNIFDVVFTTVITKAQEKLNQLYMHQQSFQRNCDMETCHQEEMDASAQDYFKGLSRSERRGYVR